MQITALFGGVLAIAAAHIASAEAVNSNDAVTPMFNLTAGHRGAFFTDVTDFTTITRNLATRTATFGAVETPDRSKEKLTCCIGWEANRQELRRAIAYFCQGGEGKMDWGGMLPADKILRAGKSLGLMYLPSDLVLLRIIVRMFDNCELDFNKWDQNACNARFDRPLDECDTGGVAAKRGGWIEDNCARWTIDPQNYKTDVDVCSKDQISVIPPPGCAGFTDKRYFYGNDDCEGAAPGP